VRSNKFPSRFTRWRYSPTGRAGEYHVHCSNHS